MNDNFDLTIAGARELNDDELMLIQGGSWLGDAWNSVKHAASDVGHAIGKAATATWNAVTSPTGQKILAGIGTVVGALGFLFGGHSNNNSNSSSSSQV